MYSPFTKLTDNFELNLFQCKNLHVVLIRGKLATKLLGRKQELVGKFGKWTISSYLTHTFILTLLLRR